MRDFGSSGRPAEGFVCGGRRSAILLWTRYLLPVRGVAGDDDQGVPFCLYPFSTTLIP